jgi:hypothetical protein
MIKMRVYIVLIVFVLFLLSGCKGKIIPEDNKVILDNNQATQPPDTIKESVNTIEANSQNDNTNTAIKEKIRVNESPVVQDITINTINNQKIKVNTSENNQPITSFNSSPGDDKPVDNPILDSCESEIADNELCENTTYGFPCTGLAKVNLEDNTIIFPAKNDKDYEFIFMPTDTYVEKYWDCMSKCVVRSTKISLDGIDYIDVKLYPKIANNTEFYVKITCSNLDTNYINQIFALSYNGGDTIEMSTTVFFRIKALAK